MSLVDLLLLALPHPLVLYLVKIHWSMSEEGYLNGTRVFVSNCFMFVLLALPHPYMLVVYL